MPAQLPAELRETPLRSIRRGQFWIPGERVQSESGDFQRAPLYVAWEAPETITGAYPIVLIHGGGGQGSDWCGTPDGRPGWLDHFVDAGYLTYVVDRPAHGRSWSHPDVVGPPGPPFSYQAALGLFDAEVPGHSAASWAGELGDPALDQMVAGMGFLPADLSESQRLDQDRLARLLDRIGPAVLVSHSAGGPAGWLAADSRPDLVRAIVAIEPMGPPFNEFAPGVRLDWGLTAAPLNYQPRMDSPAELEQNLDAARLPWLTNLPVTVVVGESSPFTAWAPQMVDYLNARGGSADFMNLGDHAVHGNGHAMMFERNSEQAVRPILDWLSTTI